VQCIERLHDCTVQSLNTEEDVQLLGSDVAFSPDLPIHSVSRFCKAGGGV